MEITFKCLECGYVWKPYKVEGPLAGRKCPNPICGRYETLRLDVYNESVEHARGLVLFKRLPLTDARRAVSTVFRRHGIVLRPLIKWATIARVYEKLLEDVAKG